MLSILCMHICMSICMVGGREMSSQTYTVDYDATRGSWSPLSGLKGVHVLRNGTPLASRVVHEVTDHLLSCVWNLRPRDPRRDSRGERSPWLPLETRPDSPVLLRIYSSWELLLLGGFSFWGATPPGGLLLHGLFLQGPAPPGSLLLLRGCLRQVST